MLDSSVDVSQRHKQLMSFVMNRFPKVGSAKEDHPYQIVMLPERKDFQGGLCGDMVAVLAEFVTIIASKARIVQMQSGFGERFISHVAVELLENGRWVLYDPTFNLTSRDVDGNALDVQAFKTLTQRKGEVLYEFHGDVAYPLRIESYYTDYASLLEVALIATNAHGFFHKLPPSRCFYGSINLIIAEPDVMDREIDAAFLFNSFYRLFVLVLPTLCIVEALTCMYLWMRSRSLAQES